MVPVTASLAVTEIPGRRDLEAEPYPDSLNLGRGTITQAPVRRGWRQPQWAAGGCGPRLAGPLPGRPLSTSRQNHNSASEPDSEPRVQPGQATGMPSRTGRGTGV